MKTIKQKIMIEVEVSNIKVTHDGYYSFAWKYSINGKRCDSGNYSNDFDGQTAEHFEKVLRDGHAYEIVLDLIEIK